VMAQRIIASLTGADIPEGVDPSTAALIARYRERKA